MGNRTDAAPRAGGVPSAALLLAGGSRGLLKAVVAPEELVPYRDRGRIVLRDSAAINVPELEHWAPGGAQRLAGVMARNPGV